MSPTAKLKGWQAQEKPDEAMCRVLRQIVVQSVYAHWARTGKPAKLKDIASIARDKIVQAEFYGNWKPRWGTPSKRTIDRRVNEAANPDFYPDGVARIISVTAGVYKPNMER
jgi:hypothetical protein